jgi:hypothetical protein
VPSAATAAAVALAKCAGGLHPRGTMGGGDEEEDGGGDDGGGDKRGGDAGGPIRSPWGLRPPDGANASCSGAGRRLGRDCTCGCA